MDSPERLEDHPEFRALLPTMTRLERFGAWLAAGGADWLDYFGLVWIFVCATDLLTSIFWGELWWVDVLLMLPFVIRTTRRHRRWLRRMGC